MEDVIKQIRQDFPFFRHHPELVFLDSAASAQKPNVMIDLLVNAYTQEYANVHRGLYQLSDIATRRFEEARKKVADFIGAASDKTIVFTKGATESINLVALSWGMRNVDETSEIIITQMEHHANIVPWQQLCKEKGAKLLVAPINDMGELKMDEFEQLLSKNTALIAITHASNVLGTINDIKAIAEKARLYGATLLVDACQSAAHFSINVQDLDCDFLVFSAHKLYGPNGVGVLYAKEETLNSMMPYQTGGAMVTEVTERDAKFQPPPLRFEAGTPCIAEVIAFAASIDYLNQLPRNELKEYHDVLLKYVSAEIRKLNNFRILAMPQDRIGVLSFVHKNAHSSDIGQILDKQNIAIRTGHHCAMPLMQALGIESSARCSLGIYTNFRDVERFIAGLTKIDQLFS